MDGMNGWVDGWMDGWMDGWGMDGWGGGWMHMSINESMRYLAK
jgi:hypothetical protein